MRGGRALVPIGLPEHMLMQRVCRFAARRVPYVELYHVKLHAPPAAESVAMDGGCRTNHSESWCIDWSVG